MSILCVLLLPLRTMRDLDSFNKIGMVLMMNVKAGILADLAAMGRASILNPLTVHNPFEG